MKIDGITWHASVTDAGGFASMRTLITDGLGLTSSMEGPGFAMFAMPNGTMFELYGGVQRVPAAPWLQRRWDRLRVPC